jgi:hypothetical protein
MYKKTHMCTEYDPINKPGKQTSLYSPCLGSCYFHLVAMSPQPQFTDTYGVHANMQSPRQ